tara:strand:+ start:685 stop:1665 length:981 start_codon:yes stop_codon:yes gene_type:complete
MDILVYEHILGEEFEEKPSSLLLNEAKLIIKHVMTDFSLNYPDSKISLLTNKKNINILTGLDLIYRNFDKNLINDIESYSKIYKKVLILAPEENLEMYNIVKGLESKGVSMINCNSKFIKITTSKNETYNSLKNSKEYLLNTYLDYKKIEPDKKIVAKINDGLGSDNLYIFKDKKDLEINRELITRKHLFQEYKEGITISINIVARKKDFRIISINEQIYQSKSYCEIYLKEIIIGKYNFMYSIFKLFVDNVMVNFNGYDGFFGIDVILDTNNNIYFLEINPRLTSSYIGLKPSLGFNPIIFLDDISYNFDINNNKIVVENIKNEK